MDPLLAQIKELLAQYLAQGEDTPVAAEAQALSDAIDSTGGDPESPESAPPEGDPGQALAQMMATSPEEDAEDPMSMAPETQPSSFEEASAMAMEDMKKRKKGQ